MEFIHDHLRRRAGYVGSVHQESDDENIREINRFGKEIFAKNVVSPVSTTLIMHSAGYVSLPMQTVINREK